MLVAIGPILVVVTSVGCTMAHLVAVEPDPVVRSTERGSWGRRVSTVGLSWVMLGLCWDYLGASWGFVINLFINHKKHRPHLNAKLVLALPLSSENAASKIIGVIGHRIHTPH